MRKWTDEEIEYLKENYSSKSSKEIAAYLGRTSHAVQNMARQHNLRATRYWSDEKKKFLTENYGKYSNKELAEMLGTKPSCIRQFAYKNGLKSGRFFSPEDEEYIANHVGRMSYAKIAKKLGRDMNSVKDKVRDMGIGYCWENVDGYIHLNEIARMVGRDRSTINKTWRKKGLQIKKMSKFSFVEEKHLYKFMEEHPECYRADECEEWFFSDKAWFKAKQKAEHDEYLKWKWGIEA